MVHHAKENFGIWRNRQPHGANPTAFLSGEDLGIPSGDVGIPTQSPEIYQPPLSTPSSSAGSVPAGASSSVQRCPFVGSEIRVIALD